jgi:transcriptional regulator GlxA family with amidase domain
MERTRTIGILVFDGVEELDVIGPWEVLSWWTRTFPEDGYAAFCFSRTGEPVHCAKGLTVQAHHSYRSAPAMDVLIYPGGRGTRAQLEDEEQLEWVREQVRTVPLVASVCTGSLVLAAAGVLSGRAATTHWGSIERLGELDPTIDVRPDDRYVDEGAIITASGVSAGIDMALHLVDRLAGRERAVAVRRGIQYDPRPPV